MAKPVGYDNTIKPTDGIYLELYDAKTVARSATNGESWRDDTQNNILSVSVTLDGAERTQAEINRTANHEAGHTASLYHPWGLKPDVADIKQGSPKVKDETLLNNVMNSGGNDEPKLRSTTGTKLTHGQRKKVSNTITKQHKKPLNVYNKNYHHCNCNGLLFCVKFFCLCSEHTFYKRSKYFVR